MINNWEHLNLPIDYFTNAPREKQPSDIDGFRLCEDGTLIILEFKNGVKKEFSKGQKYILKKIIDMHKGDGVGIYAEHNAFVEKNSPPPDAYPLPVQLIYVKGEEDWRKPKRPATVGEVYEWYLDRAEGRY